jgi:hypothetical protein
MKIQEQSFILHDGRGKRIFTILKCWRNKRSYKRQDDLEGEIYHELWRTGRYGDIGIIVNSRIYEEGRNKIEMLFKISSRLL